MHAGLKGMEYIFDLVLTHFFCVCWPPQFTSSLVEFWFPETTESVDSV